ncbi:MAG: aldo/keto reductase [Gammaproteobacteria bacterium]|nr:aldo/keto reductase [Gammaproteobacteria bacterium]
MKYKKLGDSEIEVSLICLGTMTWGEQNSQAEAFAQMDYALERGVNFWDTAEMYPVPVKKETARDTEKIIGNWIEKTGRRAEVILATKVIGRSDRGWMRGGELPRLNRKQIHQAVDDSLGRLKTDYIDLYQVHWPNRPLGLFGEGNGSYVHKDDPTEVSIAETLSALDELVKSGKVRTVGVSNETAWGVSQYLSATEQGLSKIVSIQNSYSLINRIFEGGLSEFAYRENVGLLAYSPLGMGALSGKYIDGLRPVDSRMARFPDFMTRYQSAVAETAIREYAELSQQHGLTPTQLALGFVNTRPFVTANIIGATNLVQLKENIDTAEVTISEELEKAIEDIHSRCKNPAAA